VLATLYWQQTNPDTKVSWTLRAEWRILLLYASAEWENFGVNYEFILVVDMHRRLGLDSATSCA
jgi:hypothetical protein